MKTAVTLLIGLALVLATPHAGAGAASGPVFHRDTVLAGRTDVFSIVFKGHERAIVVVTGDGSSDLDCEAIGSDGIVADTDYGPSDTCRLTFTPSWTGKFSVKIMNRGGNPNEYLLRTN